MRRTSMLVTAIAIATISGCANPPAEDPGEAPRSATRPAATADPDSLVYIALREHDLPALRRALTAGHDPNVADEHGVSALHVAVNRDPEFITLLLEHGADPDVSTAGLGTPLHTALGWRKFDAVQPLLEGGADPSARDSLGRTPLHIIAQGEPDTAPTVRLLIEAGAKLEAHDDDGETPLVTAARSNGEEAAVALVEAGADIGARDQEGRPVLLNALRAHNDETARAILECIAGGDPSEGSLVERAQHAAHRTVAPALGHAAGVNATDGRGNTALHRATRDAELVELLLIAGADPNAENARGETPLHEAAEWKEAESAALLLEAGADPNAKNNSGRTPLDVAPGANNAVRSLLQKHGAR